MHNALNPETVPTPASTFAEAADIDEAIHKTSVSGVIEFHADRPQQKVLGFGAALTEASAHVFAQMPEKLQDEFIWRCFGPAEQGGNAYTLARVHLQSCDFALDNYAYVKPTLPGRDILKTFSIERDKQLLIPFVKVCLAAQPDLKFAAAPWSPPAFMKTNLNMNRGGKLRPNYYDDWARVLAAAVAAWRNEGVGISWLTAQNEPGAKQTWDSCLYTAQQEARFANDHLRPQLDAAGCGEVQLLAWDHNKEALVSRWSNIHNELAGNVDGSAAAVNAAARDAVPNDAVSAGGRATDSPFAGIAFHWYTGDFFDQVRDFRKQNPRAIMLHTEGCEAFTNGTGNAPANPEHYAHDIMGDLNAGANGYIDWNILLDETGGPNHAGNFCDAPLMYNRSTQELVENPTFSYIGQFSRYIKPGARVVPTSIALADGIETLGVINPDGSRVLVVMNTGDEAVNFVVREVAERDESDRQGSVQQTLRFENAVITHDQVLQAEMQGHAIASFIWR